MLEDEISRETVLAVSFAEHSSAYEALNRLKELEAHGKVSVRGAAVVVRDEDGKIVTREQTADESWEGTASGGLIGLLAGVLGGPIGIVIGGASGVLVGSLFDMDDDDATDSALADISKSVRVGPPGLLADLVDEDQVAIDAAMANLRGTVVRRSGADVRAELAAAEEAQREAKKQARKELREARKKKQQDEIDAKLAALKTKLGRHKEPAASS